MALAIDASTPALATSTATSVTTASFTPPDNSLLVVMYGANQLTGTDADVSSVTNTGTALTWTRRPHKTQNAGSTGGAGQPGGAEIWTAPMPTGAAITVTANGTGSGAGKEKALQVLVITGADTTQLSNFGNASSASGLPSCVVASCQAGSYVLSASSDWAQKGLGTAGTAQTIISESDVAGQITIHFWRITTPLAASGSQTMNLTAPTAEQFNQVALEIVALPSAGGGVLPFRPGQTWQRRFRHRQRLLWAPAVGTGALTGDVAATVVETDSVTAVVGVVGSVTATVTSGSTVTAVVGKVGSVTATVTETDTVSGAVGAVGAVTATVACGSTVTAVVGAVGAVSATVVCGSTVTGSTVSGLIGTVSVTVTSGSTVTAVIGAVGTVNVTVASGVTTAATVARFGSVTATVASGASVTGVLALFGAVTGTVTSGGTVTAVSSGQVVDVIGRVGVTQTTVSSVAGTSSAGGGIRVDPASTGRAGVS